MTTIIKTEKSLVKLTELPQQLKEYAVEHFDQLYELHPQERHTVTVKGYDIEVPRYQQSYMKTPAFDAEYNRTQSYMYAARNDKEYTKSLPALFEPFYEWIKSVDPNYNQCSINWYNECDRIAFHSDCTRGMIEDAAICIISLFSNHENRRTMSFREREAGEGSLQVPVELSLGSVVTTYGDTQSEYQHGVMRPGAGRRICMSFRQMKGQD